MSIEEELERIGHLTGFAPLANELRLKLGVKKGQLRKNDDLTYYSRLLNGHNIPGWGEESLVKLGNRERFEVQTTNRGRAQIKNYLKKLLQHAEPDRAGSFEPEDLLQAFDNLLLKAEYASLDASRNEDDAYLIELVYQFCRANSGKNKRPRKYQELSAKIKTALAEEVEQLLNNISLTTSISDLENNWKVILFQPGAVESAWYKEITQVETTLLGSRYYYGGTLSVFAVPDSIREQYSQILDWNTEEKQRYLQTRLYRLKSWKEQVQKFQHRDIYDKASLTRDLQERSFRGVRLSPTQVRERAELVCSYLDRYTNFEIGLTSQTLNFNFQIKNEQVVLLEGWREYPANKYSRLFGIRLEGKEIVKQFLELHQKLWSESLTNKTEVKQWIMKQVEGK